MFVEAFFVFDANLDIGNSVLRKHDACLQLAYNLIKGGDNQQYIVY